MSDKVVKLIEDVKALTVLELSELVKALEEEFGVSAAAPVAVAAAPAAAAAPVPAPQSSSSSIDAPLVGTFYAAPAPDQAPFVLPGDRVSKGQTVCLIEAMKMMSEVPAPCDCVIESVCKSNGELVAFGEPLFRYRPC